MTESFFAISHILTVMLYHSSMNQALKDLAPEIPKKASAGRPDGRRIRAHRRKDKAAIRRRTYAKHARKKQAARGSMPAAAPVEQASAESVVKLLLRGNLGILETIRRHKPASLRELSALTGRHEASLSRTLKSFAQLGIVAFRNGPHHRRAPTLVACRLLLEIDLITGRHSTFALGGPRNAD